MSGGAEQVNKTKFYDTLNLKVDASASDVKKAYRALAIRWHPDKVIEERKAEAEAKFKDITEAYEVLADPNKRKLYDQYGEQGLKSGGFQSRSASDLFEELMGSGFFGFSSSHSSSGRKRTSDVQCTLPVSCKDCYMGKTKRLHVTRNIVCETCNGQGSKKASAITVCVTCKGAGQEKLVHMLAPGMMQQMMVMCRACKGQGERIDEMDRCKTCQGKKVIQSKTRVDVHVEPGMSPGHKVQLVAQSDQAPGCDTGDLIVLLVPEEENEKEDQTEDVDDDCHIQTDGDDSKVPSHSRKKKRRKRKEKKTHSKRGEETKPNQKHSPSHDKKEIPTSLTSSFVASAEVDRPKFRRVGNSHLAIDVRIQLVEALLGFQCVFRHLDDRIVMVTSPKHHVCQHNQILVLTGQGMPVYQKPSEYGDMFLRIHVTMPSAAYVANAQIQTALRNVLPALPSLPQFDSLTEGGVTHVQAVSCKDEKYARHPGSKSTSSPQDGQFDDDASDHDGATAGQCRPM